MMERTGVSTNDGVETWPADSSDAEKLRFIEEMTCNVDAVQERVLAEILDRNAESEYLTKCGLAGATDGATFRAKVPMMTYEDLKPYIQRIANGDHSPVLTGPGYPISEIFPSSGTSGGESKLLPSVEDDADRLQLLQSLVMVVMKQYVPGHGTGKVLHFLFVHPETKTPGGLPLRTSITSVCKSRHFKNNAPRIHTSPVAAILCEDVLQGMYAQMLCGLYQCHDVSCVGAVFATGLLRAILFLQLNWKQLVDDIETGVLSPRVTDGSVREAVGAILRPDPEMARLIHAECAKGDWAGIIKRIWSNTKYINTVVTGSMAQYIPTINYYSGGLPIVSSVYASSECNYGFNLRPMCDPAEVSYTIMPNMAYFEFLPVDDDDDTTQTRHKELVDLASVEADREYEIVVTTYTGLNRYRVGDVLRVTGFHNSAPQFRFVRRENVVLSVDADKTDEAELQHAVEHAAALLHPHGADVLEYTSQVCTKSIPGHYVIYWELLNKEASGAAAMNGDVLDRCCLEMEEALSSVYRFLRVGGNSIAPLEIRLVRSGTFVELMDYCVSRGTSMSQYKVPRCVTEKPQIVEWLNSRVISNHFSARSPRWAPDH